jgi:hypothetical protein
MNYKTIFPVFHPVFHPTCQSKTTHDTTGKTDIHERTAQTIRCESQTNSQKNNFSEKSSFVPIEFTKSPSARAYRNGTPPKNSPFFAKINQKHPKTPFFSQKTLFFCTIHKMQQTAHKNFTIGKPVQLATLNSPYRLRYQTGFRNHLR